MARRKVWKTRILRIGPDLLGGVQFRRVSRKLFRHNLRMPGKISSHQSSVVVRVAPVPDNRERSGNVAAGTTYIYKVLAASEHATLSIVKHGRQWAVSELKGPCNRRPHAEMVAVVDHWLRQSQEHKSVR